VETPAQVERRLKELRAERNTRLRRNAEQRSIIHFIKRVWPWFVIEEVHLLLAGHLEALVFGDLDRLMTFMAPRTGKSMMSSIVLPSFYIGNFPANKVMLASHQMSMAVDFGRDAKDLIQDEDYPLVFPGVELKADAKAAGKWFTSKRGAFYATGVTGGIAGKGWNLGMGDDLLNEQTAYSDRSNQRVINWWGPGFYTRRQPEKSALGLTMTRWRKNDIAGYLLEKGRTDKNADQYTVLKIPAVIDELTAELLNEYSGDPLLSPSPTGKRLKFKAGDSFSPRRWPKHELMRQKANMADSAWQAQYIQSPTNEEGAILKRRWWKKWKERQPPACKLVIQVYDTAFEEDELGVSRSGKRDKEEPDFSASTTWGIFEHADKHNQVRDHMILLDRWKGQVGFPELREEAVRSNRLHKPDLILIENKASGISLRQELRRKNLPVRGIDVPGTSKTARAHSASIVFEQGCVWYVDRKFSEEVITECAEFPFGDFDDIADTVVHAAMWLRRTMHVQLGDEAPLEPDPERFEATGGRKIVIA